MIEINLIPDVKQELISARRVRATVISGAIMTSIITLSIIALLAAYVFAVQTIRNTIADDAIQKGSAKLAEVEDLSKLLTIQNQLTKINTLHDERTINSRVFDVLLAIIPPAPNDIQVSNLKIDTEDGTVTLEGQAPNGYPSLETFKKTIGVAYVSYLDSDGERQQVPLASDISTSNVSFGEDASGKKVLRFAIGFNYAPELLDSQVSDVNIVLISDGNVTDSYLGIPKSVFVDRATDLEEGQ